MSARGGVLSIRCPRRQSRRFCRAAGSILEGVPDETPKTEVDILILDDDRATQAALHQMLDSEGWRVEVVSTAQEALAEMAAGAWRLVIANIAMVGADSLLFNMLRELSHAAASPGAPPPLRALFLIPEHAGLEAQQAIERARLPYALKPFHLHDFLDKISDLLLETGAILQPIRRVRQDNKGETKPLRDAQRGRRADGAGGRQTTMFARREDYMMTEEEIAEFERQEEEERKKKQKKPEQPEHL